MVHHNVKMVQMKIIVNVIKVNIHVMEDYVLIQRNYVMEEWIVQKMMMKHIQIAVSQNRICFSK